MYELVVERGFWAAHALKLYDGSMEESHSHWWVTEVMISSEDLDAMEVVMDFHELEALIDRVLSPLNNGDLNAVALLSGVNPSAERVAEKIYQALSPELPERVALDKVRVREAEGCWAAYRE